MCRYGADTAVSLFDARLAWGWNLRKLGCMLQDPQYDVPDIPGAWVFIDWRQLRPGECRVPLGAEELGDVKQGSCHLQIAERTCLGWLALKAR